MIEKEYVIGLDISTTTIGITIMDIEGRLIEINHVSFPKASKKISKLTIYERADFFQNTLIAYKNYNIKHIFVEEPLKNGPNINTTILLAKFNGIISHIMYKIFKVEPSHITVYDARKLFFPEYIIKTIKKGVDIETLSFPKDCDKKQLVFEKVSWLEPQISWVYTKYFNLEVESYDRADSYVVCKAGLLLNGYIKNISEMPI